MVAAKLEKDKNIIDIYVYFYIYDNMAYTACINIYICYILKRFIGHSVPPDLVTIGSESYLWKKKRLVRGSFRRFRLQCIIYPHVYTYYYIGAYRYIVYLYIQIMYIYTPPSYAPSSSYYRRFLRGIHSNVIYYLIKYDIVSRILHSCAAAVDAHCILYLII